MGVKYIVNESFFNEWSSEMAYVLGYLYADGSLEDAPAIRGKYIRVSGIDLQIIKDIKKVLGSQHKINTIHPPEDQQNRKTKYLLRIGSHELYDALEKHGLCPRKSLILEWPEIPESFLAPFIRGYFDGDGSVQIEKYVNKNKEIRIKRLRVIFTCGSKEFLEDLNNALNMNAGLSDRKSNISTRSYQLAYSTHDSIKLFKFMYSDKSELFLKRKQSVFREYFKLKPNRVDEDIKAI